MTSNSDWIWTFVHDVYYLCPLYYLVFGDWRLSACLIVKIVNLTEQTVLHLSKFDAGVMFTLVLEHHVKWINFLNIIYTQFIES